MKKSPEIVNFKPKPLAARLSPQRIKVLKKIKQLTIERANAQHQAQKREYEKEKRENKKKTKNNNKVDKQQQDHKQKSQEDKKNINKQTDETTEIQQAHMSKGLKRRVKQKTRSRKMQIQPEIDQTNKKQKVKKKSVKFDQNINEIYDIEAMYKFIGDQQFNQYTEQDFDDDSFSLNEQYQHEKNDQDRYQSDHSQECEDSKQYQIETKQQNKFQREQTQNKKVKNKMEKQNRIIQYKQHVNNVKQKQNTRPTRSNTNLKLLSQLKQIEPRKKGRNQKHKKQKKFNTQVERQQNQNQQFSQNETINFHQNYDNETVQITTEQKDSQLVTKGQNTYKQQYFQNSFQETQYQVDQGLTINSIQDSFVLHQSVQIARKVKQEKITQNSKNENKIKSRQNKTKNTINQTDTIPNQQMNQLDGLNQTPVNKRLKQFAQDVNQKQQKFSKTHSIPKLNNKISIESSFTSNSSIGKIVITRKSSRQINNSTKSNKPDTIKQKKQNRKITQNKKNQTKKKIRIKKLYEQPSISLSRQINQKRETKSNQDIDSPNQSFNSYSEQSLYNDHQSNDLPSYNEQSTFTNISVNTPYREIQYEI